ncbi:MAG: protein kinase domain-containing protein [Blastocatellia bacterium]
MTPDRWARIDQLLDKALERPAAERSTFLDEVCGEDGELRQEVESLLAAHRKAEEKFLDRPALDLAAQHFAQQTGRSLIGQTLGHYGVISVLGVGGMGEVYLARDTRLERKVAIKLLPPQYTSDRARIKRFEREARAASALNHPNIITIYEIGEIEGKHFIAAEFVDGQTLRELMSSGRIAAKDAIEIAIQIASALSAAYEAGIIHRDIKPENVMRRRDGYVKVLDFGLVKLIEQSRLPGQTNASEGDIGKTNPGAVLGTVRYMSPEQALGQEVDHRSDIFSLGVLLYEMVTGVPPFKGGPAAALDAIVHHQPLPVTEVFKDLHPELERIVSRALEKDRDLRYQTANDFRSELKRLQRELDSSPSHSFVLPRLYGKSRLSINKKKIGAMLALTAFVVMAASIMAWRQTRGDERVAWSRAVATQLTGFTGAELFPAFSPDAKEFVYARNEKDNWDIYQQRLAGSVARNLTANSPDDDMQPAYSPDGELIAFRSERKGGGIFVMSAAGESVRQVSNFGHYPDWSPDGKEIAFSSMLVVDPFSRGANSKLYAFSLATGETREIDAGRDAVQPRWSPNRLRIAFWGKDRSAQRDIWTVSPRGGDPVQVTHDADFDWNPVWSPDGKFIYFISNRKGAPSLWRVAMDEASGRAMGEPEPIIGPLAQSWQLNISRDGRRLVYVEKLIRERIHAVNFDPVKYETAGQAIPILEGSKRSSSPDVSPDGQWLTYYSRGETNEDIFVVRTDGTAQSQLTNDSFNDRLPRWSPDGKRIVYYSNASGKYEIWTINQDGSERRQISFNNGQQPSFNSGTSLVYPVLSPDGRWISYCIAAGETFLIDANKPWNEQKPLALPFIKPRAEWFIAWSWSPDSKKLAGWASDHNGEYPGSYVYSLESQRFEKIADVGMRQYWLSDNRHLICVDGCRIFLLDSLTKSARKILDMPPREIRGASISADSRRIYFSVVTDESDIRLLTLE